MSDLFSHDRTTAGEASMSMNAYTAAVDLRKIPQSEPAVPTQVQNNAGGFTFAVDDWTRLDRALILGTEGGTYYAGERAHTKQALDGVKRAIALDGERVVRRVVEISESARAPKNDPAIAILALCARSASEATRRAAYEAMPHVCRTGTHLFSFAEMMQATGGWGRGLRRAVGRWYTGRSTEALARQATKYRQRDGWSHRDLLRLAHPKADSDTRKVLFDWICRGWPGIGEAPPVDPAQRRVWAFERAQRTSDPVALASLILTESLVREDLPTEALGSALVWDSLLRSGKGMPLTAMIRNLGKMSAVGLLTPLSDAERFVVSRLRDVEALREARVHPFGILLAARQYAAGHGDRGTLTWKPSGPVVSALEEAFVASFATVKPTGKRHMLALDVSGSMGGGSIAGSTITPREASAAMALVTLAVEDACHVIGFTGQNSVSVLDFLRRGVPLNSAVQTMHGLPMGPTDCAAPMIVAFQQKIPVDAFVVYTDNETWAGTMHPHVALKQYRQATGIAAKMIVVGLTATEFTIADPNDAGMMDVVGFDAAAPSLMSEFIR